MTTATVPATTCGTLRFAPEVCTNEYRLLLICARRRLSEPQVAVARGIVAGGIDWDLLHRHAEQHSLSTLLYWHLQRVIQQDLPNGQQRRSRLGNNVQNLHLTASLLKILEALQDARIRALAYKGPALAALLYGDVALRTMSDLDLVIEPKSLPAAQQILSSLGFQRVIHHSPKQDAARLRSDCECEFSSSDQELTVDLHWQITPRHLSQRFSFDDFWNRRREVKMGQKLVPTFSAEDTTLILAVHGGKHLWQRLGWLADFAESLKQHLDWQSLFAKARKARAERMLRLGLALAQEIMGVELPSEIDTAIGHDTGVRQLALQISRVLLNDENPAEPAARRWLTMLRLADNRWGGIRCAMRFAFESGPREWEAVRLPDSLFALYPLVRIATLARAIPALLFANRERNNLGATTTNL